MLLSPDAILQRTSELLDVRGVDWSVLLLAQTSENLHTTRAPYAQFSILAELAHWMVHEYGLHEVIKLILTPIHQLAEYGLEYLVVKMSRDVCAYAINVPTDQLITGMITTNSETAMPIFGARDVIQLSNPIIPKNEILARARELCPNEVNNIQYYMSALYPKPRPALRRLLGKQLVPNALYGGLPRGIYHIEELATEMYRVKSVPTKWDDTWRYMYEDDLCAKFYPFVAIGKPSWIAFADLQKVETSMHLYPNSLEQLTTSEILIMPGERLRLRVGESARINWHLPPIKIIHPTDSMSAAKSQLFPIIGNTVLLDDNIKIATSSILR